MMRNKHSGKVLDGRYEIRTLLDVGGMGAVYLGRHIKLGRSVAVKFLHGELAGNKDVVTRFYREAQAASGISHPNIIDVYDVGVAEWGEPYLVMEYLSGENLASLLERKGPISLAAACGIMEPVLRALHAAHERGIVHRDLKPDNIFLMHQEDAPPIIKVIDFGISKFLQTEQTRLTRTGALLGTPSYMSPEQARGRGTFDHRADIYSIGVVLHSMLCGSLPFVGESYNDLIVNILTEPVKKPSETCPDFPVEAEPIVLRLLEKDPERRFATCMELLEALASLDAFAQRQEALRDLVVDMPEGFATGDLGEPSEFHDEIAATLYAEMGENGAETVWDRLPDDGLAGLGDLKVDEKPSAAGVPSTAARLEGRRRGGGVPLFLAGLVVVGIGAGLYAIGLFPALWSSAPGQVDATAPALSDSSALTLPEKPDDEESPLAVAPPPQEATGDSLTAEDTATELNGTDSNPETGALDSDPAAMAGELPGEGSLPESPIKSPRTDGSPSPPSSPPSGSESVAESESAPLISATISHGEAFDAAASSAQNRRVASPVESTVDAPAAGSAGLSPLTPAEVNRLVETRHGKVMTCYDLARAKTPELAGTLELQVGMTGSTVLVSVSGGNVSGYLAECVMRVIRSISVPPNDGTLVEILKEYEFR